MLVGCAMSRAPLRESVVKLPALPSNYGELRHNPAVSAPLSREYGGVEHGTESAAGDRSN
jgi:hypothetical protein